MTTTNINDVSDDLASDKTAPDEHANTFDEAIALIKRGRSACAAIHLNKVKWGYATITKAAARDFIEMMKRIELLTPAQSESKIKVTLVHWDSGSICYLGGAV